MSKPVSDEIERRSNSGELLIQPDDHVAPIVAAIKGAKKSVDIVIFRFDRKEIEAALRDAAGRGVRVHA